MLRFLIVILGAMSLILPASACNMASDARSDDLVGYVSNGLNCLATPPDAFRFDVDAEQLFERAINEVREQAGLNRLKLRPETRAAARFHSLDMGANAFFSHSSPAGRAHDARIAAFDRRLLSDRSAENVAQFGPAVCLDQDENEVSCLLIPGFKLPTRSEVVGRLHRQLMDSEGHRENILDPDVTHMAVGVARTDTGFYVTQLFVSVAGTLETPLPVALETGQALKVDVDLDGWDGYSFAVSTTDEPIDLKSGKLPRKLSGDVTLNVRAERVERADKNRKPERVFWIYLTGPSATIIPAKES